jgi:hypothetical protein
MVRFAILREKRKQLQLRLRRDSIRTAAARGYTGGGGLS